MVDTALTPEQLRSCMTHWLPAPRFLEMPAVGIDVSDDSIRFLSFDINAQGLVIDTCGVVPLAPGVVIGGEINDAEALIRVLREAREKHNFSFVKVSLPEEKAYIFRTTLPTTHEDEVAHMLEFKLEENVPLSPNEVFFDYRIIERAHTFGRLDVGVTVFPREIIHTYMRICEKAGLIPLAFEIEAQAMTRAVVPFGLRDTRMVVNIERVRTGISISTSGVADFTTTLEIGGGAVTKAIEKHFSVGEAEAERIKFERGFIRDRNNRDLFDTMMGTMSALKDEINKYFRYWQTHGAIEHETHDRISRIMLVGSEAALPGLASYLENALGVPVEVANVWRNAISFDEYIPPLSFRDSLSYATAIGLALHDRLILC